MTNMTIDVSGSTVRELMEVLKEMDQDKVVLAGGGDSAYLNISTKQISFDYDSYYFSKEEIDKIKDKLNSSIKNGVFYLKPIMDYISDEYGYDYKVSMSCIIDSEDVYFTYLTTDDIDSTTSFNTKDIVVLVVEDSLEAEYDFCCIDGRFTY
jgi:hypothetical protein